VRGLVCGILLLAACGEHGAGTFPALSVAGSARAAESFPVPPPPFTQGIFPCSRCHLGGAPDPAPEGGFPHARHLARDLVCADCHGEGEPAIPAVEACLECHEPLDKEPEAVRAYVAQARESGFPRRWKTRDAIPNHAGHAKAGVLCAACHGEPTDAPFAKPRPVPLMERCQACHAERKAPAECATCHRETREPQHKAIVLHHAEEQRGCLDCHSRDDRDSLHHASGAKIPFTESYRLCGQCHGDKLRDWKAGLHGKRTGSWDGRKDYLLCAHCHNPHSPRFPKLEPKPPPVRPEDVR
jgi:hypothetical protein